MVISTGSFFLLLALVVILVLIVLWASQTNYPGPIDFIKSIFTRNPAVASSENTEKQEAPAVPRRSVTVVQITPEIQPPPRKSIKLPTPLDIEKKEEKKEEKTTFSVPSTPVVKDEYIYV